MAAKPVLNSRNFASFLQTCPPVVYVAPSNQLEFGQQCLANYETFALVLLFFNSQSRHWRFSLCNKNLLPPNNILSFFFRRTVEAIRYSLAYNQSPDRFYLSAGRFLIDRHWQLGLVKTVALPKSFRVPQTLALELVLSLIGIHLKHGALKSGAPP